MIFKCTLYYEKIKQDKFQLSLPGKNNNKKEERTQINKIRNETGQITTNITETQRIIGKYNSYILTAWTT